MPISSFVTCELNFCITLFFYCILSFSLSTSMSSSAQFILASTYCSSRSLALIICSLSYILRPLTVSSPPVVGPSLLSFVNSSTLLFSFYTWMLSVWFSLTNLSYSLSVWGLFWALSVFWITPRLLMDPLLSLALFF